MSKKLELKDKEFHRLTVLRESENRTKGGHVKWWCQCSCGSEPFEVIGHHLVSGDTQSCGCYKTEKSAERLTTHGESLKIPEYCAWRRMKDRCLNENFKGFKNYGGRGIKICDRWLDSYENFLADMGRKPSENHSLDRETTMGIILLRIVDGPVKKSKAETGGLIDY